MIAVLLFRFLRLACLHVRQRSRGRNGYINERRLQIHEFTKETVKTRDVKYLTTSPEQ